MNNSTVPSSIPVSIPPMIVASSPTLLPSVTTSKSTPHIQDASSFRIQTHSATVTPSYQPANTMHSQSETIFMVRSTTNFPDFTDLSVNQISISSHTTQRSALHSISLSTSTVPSTASTATVVPGAPTITNHSDALGMAIILGITIPLGVLVLALVFIVVVFYWFRKHRAKQDVVLLHYGETDYVVMVSAAAGPSEEVATNKPHNEEDYEQATDSAGSSYYDFITEDTFTREDVDNSTVQYDHITHENGNTESEYSALQHFIQHSRQKVTRSPFLRISTF